MIQTKFAIYRDISRREFFTRALHSGKRVWIPEGTGIVLSVVSYGDLWGPREIKITLARWCDREHPFELQTVAQAMVECAARNMAAIWFRLPGDAGVYKLYPGGRMIFYPEKVLCAFDSRRWPALG